MEKISQRNIPLFTKVVVIRPYIYTNTRIDIVKLKYCVRTLMLFQILDKNVKWQCWVNQRVTRKEKSGKEKKETKKALVEKNEPTLACVTDMCDKLETFSVHLFLADWQFEQYTIIRDNPPKGWVLSVIDFAENFRCIYQDEISAAYYSYEQAGIIPVQIFHRCVDENCEQVMLRSLLYITDDLKHDNPRPLF